MMECGFLYESLMFCSLLPLLGPLPRLGWALARLWLPPSLVLPSLLFTPELLSLSPPGDSPVCMLSASTSMISTLAVATDTLESGSLWQEGTLWMSAPGPHLQSL